MSGEYCETQGHYFHHHIAEACEKHKNEPEPLIRLYGELLEHLAPLARRIAWYKACDSGEEVVVEEYLERMDAIKAIVRQMDAELDVFRDVITRAVANALDEIA